MQAIETFESMERRNRKLSIDAEFDESNFNSKIIATKQFIAQCLSVSNNPIILCSFGKDSMVMMDLVHSIRKDVPVIFWREPFHQSKFEWPQQVSAELGLTVYDYPPFATDYYQNGEYLEIFNFYTLGNASINLYTGCIPSEDDDSICALKMLTRPKCIGYEFQWDCVFHGHKQTDPIYVDAPQKLTRVKHFGNGILTLPIVNWTDEEIWYYIDKFNVPYNKDRYVDGKSEKNADHYKTCFKCLDSRNEDTKIHCPKRGVDVAWCGKSSIDHASTKDGILASISGAA